MKERIQKSTVTKKKARRQAEEKEYANAGGNIGIWGGRGEKRCLGYDTHAPRLQGKARAKRATEIKKPDRGGGKRILANWGNQDGDLGFGGR